MAETWDPSQYLKFAAPRLRPALDLLARIDTEAPSAVYDLGCGTGMATRMLAARWPEATVTGVDSSPEMLSTARREEGGMAIAWVESDVAGWAPSDGADVLFSNAALHWLEDHERLFPRLFGCLRRHGVLAVQMPRNHLAPPHVCMAEAARAGPWRARLEAVLRPAPVAAPDAYYDILAPLADAVDIWETEYTHVLDGENPVMEWTKSTALRPLLAALDDGQRDGFLIEYAAHLAAAYPGRPDGTTIFPFRRLFIVARM
jgi:trans-aconitate 2-methyltransferase